jgi:hypothetical protein
LLWGPHLWEIRWTSSGGGHGLWALEDPAAQDPWGMLPDLLSVRTCRAVRMRSFPGTRLVRFWGQKIREMRYSSYTRIFRKRIQRIRLKDAIQKVRLMASLNCPDFNTLTVPEKWKNVQESRHRVRRGTQGSCTDMTCGSQQSVELENPGEQCERNRQ